MSNYWLDPPPPCPVDDAPHTACCSPGYAGTSRHAIVVGPIVPATRIVMTGGQLSAVPAPPTAEPTPAPTFTTSTYKRQQHGPQTRAKRKARP